MATNLRRIAPPIASVDVVRSSDLRTIQVLGGSIEARAGLTHLRFRYALIPRQYSECAACVVGLLNLRSDSTWIQRRLSQPPPRSALTIQCSRRRIETE